MKKNFSWSLFVISFGAFVLVTQFLGQIFFINRTSSMPVGIYLKSSPNKIKMGEIIVFLKNNFRGNLIKRVVALPNQEFCFDESGDLWVDQILVAKKSAKYLEQESQRNFKCQTLLPDELLVLGEHPDSYDSRYFGPIKRNQVIASVKLLWQFDSEK